LLFTQHPIATEFEEVLGQVQPSLSALIKAIQFNCQVIITYPNNDAGGDMITVEINKIMNEHFDHIQAIPSLGWKNNYGLLNYTAHTTRGACIGNSSSGIKETPAFHCPAINIGDRQKGRLLSDNVIDALYDERLILEAIQKALFDDTFREICQKCENPYGTDHAGEKIDEILASVSLDKKLIQKKMTY